MHVYHDKMGYINYLKDCDSGVQWALFIPEVVKKHGHKINRDSFEYIEIGKVRFIGKEFPKNPDIHLSHPAESLLLSVTGEPQRGQVPTVSPFSSWANKSAYSGIGTR